MAQTAPLLRRLGLRDYADTYGLMREFTAVRDPQAPDELWFLEHPPVFTQGQAGKPEHVLAPGAIPIVQSNRGGQVTYHGPGQAVVYVLLDLHRLGYGPRELVRRLEQAMLDTLAGYGIAARARADAPGVYVERAWDGAATEMRKIGSLGLRVSRGCSYHGIALNVAMDLEPFSRINPCGLSGMRMTQVSELGGPSEVVQVMRDLEPAWLNNLGLASQ
ncbi:MAG: lipoyl(octanoyl) transferase LipB [Nevskia sp.]|nr:lipoyl(octanoyl) transferase LipB [Nevskia sp.]